MLRNALLSTTEEEGHIREQPPKKWRGFSEYPETFDNEERLLGERREETSETRQLQGCGSPESGRIVQAPMNLECKLSRSTWLVQHNKDLQTLGSVLNLRQGD